MNRWQVAVVLLLLLLAWVGSIGYAVEGREDRIPWILREEPSTSWLGGQGVDLSHQLHDWFYNSAQKAAGGLPKLLQGRLEDLEDQPLDFSGVYLPSTDPSIVNNSACIKDVETFYRAGRENLTLTLALMEQFWPITMPDSWGKFPDGVLNGNIMPWGMMEQCTYLTADVELGWPIAKPKLEAHFKGRYCLVTYRRNNETDTLLEDLDDDVNPLTRIGNLITLDPAPLFLRYGTCMPDSCTPEDLRVSIADVVAGGDVSGLILDCHTKGEQTILNAGDIAFIVVLSIFGCLILLGGMVDIAINYFDKQHFRKGPLKYLLIFSFYTNLAKIFHINTNEAPEVISCLHGIRVMSMLWVVWCHGYAIGSLASSNIVGQKRLTDDPLEQTIMNGFVSVDTFFFMSGLLMVYGLMKEYTRTHHVNWIMYYVHRLIRLTPPIIVTGAFMATLARLTLVGPLAGTVERVFIHKCREYWWVDALYLSNFMLDEMCLLQCWYTAVDTQLYLVAPLVLVPLVYKPKMGMAWMGLVTVISVMIPMILTGVYNLSTNIAFPHPIHISDVDTYMDPWCRASPYLVGMWTGLILHHLRNKEVKMRGWQAVLGWLVAATIGLAVVYGMMEYNTKVDPKTLTKAVNVAYEGLSRAGWATALFWVVFACHKGYGGPINTFLAHPCWQPLSRLTYCLYLTTLTVQALYNGAIFTPLYLNHLNQFINTSGTFFVSGIIAVLLSLVSEGPFLGLEKILLKRPGRSETEKAKGS